MSFKISVIVPTYNEEKNVWMMAQCLEDILSPINCFYEIIFVDDGSQDNTLAELEKLRQHNSSIHYISFSRNFGHQYALKAGLDMATGDCVISMDADLQHPPALLIPMIDKWQEGYDVVYTQRLEDAKLPFFKRVTSRTFYKLMNWLSDIEIEEGTADFRLMDKVVVNVFKQLPERDLFIRGLVKWMGFKQYCMPYQPNQRYSGTSKYSLKKMLLFALNGITSFSVKPLRLAMIIGFTLSLISFSYAVFAFLSYLFTNWNTSGWTSVIMGVLFIGGLQLIMLGIIGEYIGKLFMQAKQRPSYIVKKNTLDESPTILTKKREFISSIIARQKID
ncbi:glycosyltransferase family 2 protein [Xanthocytophaga flava]|uniref:glycosyltransferase family 2 protein n=1 Tax=Xanthocytophaga flava TaxID=3048013 RepID=UPI0028D8572E|nr:glycosyltransferase family 2 protein [Xanthocytophaga flavus]MDJ1469141.1 glycosyltransferase family 2 protein [Xanthocytophaga flavus]